MCTRLSLITEPCRTCGAPASVRCADCSAPCCATDANYYFDDTNAAITRAALPKCVVCWPPQHARPYTIARALAQDEVDFDIARRSGWLA